MSQSSRNPTAVTSPGEFDGEQDIEDIAVALEMEAPLEESMRLIREECPGWVGQVVAAALIYAFQIGRTSTYASIAQELIRRSQ